MSQIREWQYDRLTELCGEHQKHFVSAVLYHSNESIRLSSWLRLMGLMETWDMCCDL